jgi:hypothetical protein
MMRARELLGAAASPRNARSGRAVECSAFREKVAELTPTRIARNGVRRHLRYRVAGFSGPCLVEVVRWMVSGRELAPVDARVKRLVSPDQNL